MNVPKKIRAITSMDSAVVPQEEQENSARKFVQRELLVNIAKKSATAHTI